MHGNTVEFKGRTYRVDPLGCLADLRDWDEGFAEGMAPRVGITGGLTDEHWQVIRFLRRAAAESGRHPLIYQTCKANALHLKDLKRLFPSGYLRGACTLAGLNYDEGYCNEAALLAAHLPGDAPSPAGKTYRVDARGYLVDDAEWDERFALCKAVELGLQGPFTDRHWRVVRFLRDAFARRGRVPTVYETCESNAIGLEDLEALFPSGYHRGAVKIAGLRAAAPDFGPRTTNAA